MPLLAVDAIRECQTKRSSQKLNPARRAIRRSGKNWRIADSCLIDVAGNHAIQFALGAENVLYGFTHGPFAARALGDIVRPFLDLRMCVGRGNGQPERIMAGRSTRSSPMKATPGQPKPTFSRSPLPAVCAYLGTP